MIYLARTSSPPQIPPPRKRSDGFDSFGSDEKLQNFAGFSGASSSNNLLVPAFLPFNELIQKINTSNRISRYMYIVYSLTLYPLMKWAIHKLCQVFFQGLMKNSS